MTKKLRCLPLWAIKIAGCCAMPFAAIAAARATYLSLKWFSIWLGFGADLAGTIGGLTSYFVGAGIGALGIMALVTWDGTFPDKVDGKNGD